MANSTLDFFPPDENYAKILSGDFRVRAADTDVAAYTTRILATFKAACGTAPGINNVLDLYQPFYECFVDRNRRFHRSTDQIEFLLAAIYTNDTEYDLYAHIAPTNTPAPVTEPEETEGGE